MRPHEHQCMAGDLAGSVDEAQNVTEAGRDLSRSQGFRDRILKDVAKIILGLQHVCSTAIRKNTEAEAITPRLLEEGQ